jgi:hypothetical protein
MRENDDVIKTKTKQGNEQGQKSFGTKRKTVKQFWYGKTTNL